MLKLRSDHADILGTSPTVQQGVDVVVENVKWLNLHEKEIDDWLPKTEVTISSTTPSSGATNYQIFNAVIILFFIQLGMMYSS